MIYVTGDTHGDDFQRFRCWSEGQSLTKDDFVIICGDFGLVWYPTMQQVEQHAPAVANKYASQIDALFQQEETGLAWVSEHPWTTLFIDGNHENFDRLLKYPVQDFHGGKASQIHDTVWHLRRGEVFELNGKKCFVMGGASSHDKHRRTEGISWWPQEVPSEEEYGNAIRNLERHDWHVDFVFTHTVPEVIRRKIPQHFGDIYRDKDAVTEMLETIRKRLKFKRWYFGHFHRDIKIDRYRALYFDISEAGK